MPIEIAAYQNTVTLDPSANSCLVEAVDIYTHYLFLHPAQTMEEHEEV